MSRLFTQEELDRMMRVFVNLNDLHNTELEDEVDFAPIEEENNIQTQLDSVIGKYDQEVLNKARIEARVSDGEEKPIYLSDCDVQEYVHIGDLHLPFQVDKWVSDVVAIHGNRDKVLIINGDFLDCHDVSSFPKSKAVGLNNEVSLAKALLKDWASKFKKIYLIAGNHEKRMATYIRKRISPEVVSLVEDDILKNIVDDLKLSNLIYMSGDTTNWYMQIDNVICCHPNDYKRSNSGILHTATFALPYFEAYHPDANVFIMAHTHHLGIGIFRSKVIAEAGCLCQQQDYAASGNLSYTPQARGYVTFTSRRNKVTFNDIELHYLG